MATLEKWGDQTTGGPVGYQGPLRSTGGQQKSNQEGTGDSGVTLRAPRWHRADTKGILGDTKGHLGN